MYLYHTGDLHDNVGFAPALQSLRAENPGLYFDAGDSLRGSQTVYRRNERIIAELAAAGCDLQAMGNREFHYIFGLLAARARKMPYPLLCANLVDTHGRTLPYTAQKLLNASDGRSIRVFGLLVPQYPVGSPWERLLGWRFLDPVTVAREVAASAASDELLVCLSHLGLPADRLLAAAVPRIDVILGGHSHDTLAQPEYVGDVPIVHAGPYAKFVSRTRFSWESGRARIAEFDLMPLGGTGDALQTAGGTRA